MNLESKDARASMPTLQFRTSRGAVEHETVDSWELKASRRALMNLRTLLYGQPMLDLIDEQIREADAYYSSLVAASDGRYRECRVDIALEGFSGSEFLKWFMSAMMLDPKESAVTVVFPAHPEHYAAAPGGMGIIELIGGHIARVFMAVVDPAQLPPSVTDLADETYPSKLAFTLHLEDRTPFGYLLNEFRDTNDGGDIILRVMFPAAAPDDFVDGHTEHFCIEFAHWVRQAMAEVASAADS